MAVHRSLIIDGPGRLTMAKDLEHLKDQLGRTTGWEINPSDPGEGLLRILQVSSVSGPEPELHDDSSGRMLRLLFWRDSQRSVPWRLADQTDWRSTGALVAELVPWLMEAEAGADHHGRTDTPVGELIEELCGWVDRLLTRNLMLERFLEEAYATARDGVALREQIAELQKDLEQARLINAALAVEPKKATQDGPTARRTTHALQTVVKKTSFGVLTFIASAGGALAPTVYAANSADSRAGDRIAALEAEVREIHDGIDTPCRIIIQRAGGSPQVDAAGPPP